MPSLLGLHLGRYDPAASKPSKGWCNDIPYDDTEAEAEWEEYIQRHGSIENNQFDDVESVESFKIEEASEEAIEDEIEQAQLEERASLESRMTKYFEIDAPVPRFLNLPVRVSTELVPVRMNELLQQEVAKVAKVAKENNDYESEEDAIAAKYLTPEQLAEEDFDDDLVFDLTPETCPGPLSPRELPQKIPLRIFVATWNMAAEDPFAHRRRGQYIGDDLAAETLRELLPLGYDVYVIGTQEKVTKHLNEAVLARLQQHPTGEKYQRLVATTKQKWQQSRTHDECEHLRHLRTYESSDFGSLAGLTSFCGSEAACNMCSPHAASAYSPRGRFSCDDVAMTRNSMPQTETVDNGTCCSWWKKQGEEKEIRGHGDHALIRRKSTGLSVFYASHLHGQIQAVAAGSHKFTGSKGGIAVTIRVAGDPQTLTFVSCHLEANRIERRRRQLDKLTRELPRSLGFTKDTIATCSDHVIWMGDFNYRIKDLAGSEVLSLLSAGRLQELHDNYDSMADDLENIPGLKTFREPAKWPTFYPTYKKVASRSKLPLSGSTTGTGQDTRWAQHVYKTTFREPFYKGGRVRERVPGWCDRILYCSRPESAWTENLKVEQAACSDANRGRSSFSNEPVRDNYRALNDELRGSDHSPVSCTFLWSVQR
ncbi:hypothetical protein V7S43_002295 [Phytophthora oleae]|uniref:Inositol polyphosphate-related phosphatase domain-containing protein n=1 Tax=Phytophthora oleae TaxID=2107226 RepID=A0ABD3G200_9STRA